MDYNKQPLRASEVQTNILKSKLKKRQLIVTSQYLDLDYFRHYSQTTEAIFVGD